VEVSTWLTEMEINLATAKSDLANLNDLLIQSVNRQAETESKLNVAEQKVCEMEKKLATCMAVQSSNNHHNDNDEDMKKCALIKLYFVELL